MNNKNIDSENNGILIVFYEFFDALLELIVAFIKKLYRGIRYLPYYISGANPYVFSKDSGISMSLYSRVQVHLFGWMSVVVVIYIFGASQKIASQLNFLGVDKEKYSFFYYVFSSITFSTIVFFFERFILSNPKIRKSAEHILWENVFSKRQSHWIKIPYLVFYYVKTIIKSIPSILLVLLRITLSLIIASLISATMLFQINEHQVSNKLEMMKSITINSLIQTTDDYKSYKMYVEKARQKFFEKEALTICRGYARAGKLPNISNVITDKEINMESAPRDSFSETQTIPAQIICPVKNPEPCYGGEFCPEASDISERLGEAKNEHEKAMKYYVESSAGLETKKLQLINSIDINDFSGQIQALTLLYKDLYKKDKIDFFVSIGITSPFLLILLLFELLPTIAKLTFPNSSYDRLIADEELYYEFKSLALINVEARDYFDSFAKLFKEDFIFLEKLRKIEYEKKHEFSSALEKAFDSLKDVLMAVLDSKSYPSYPESVRLFNSEISPKSIGLSEYKGRESIQPIIIVGAGVFLLACYIIYKSLMPYPQLSYLLKFIGG